MPVSKATTQKTQKTAKKPAQKTAKRMTQADIEANFDRIQKIIEEMGMANEKAFNEMWSGHSETRETLDKAIKETRETLDKAIKETRETFDKAIKGTEKTIEAMAKDRREAEKALNKAIGGLSNTMGAVVERFMTAGLPQKFQQFGFAFGRVTTVKWAGGENNIYTEIDGLLENGDQAMVVEVKTTLRSEDVDDQLECMEKVRKYADLHGDKREFFGAIAATIIDTSSRTYALKKGLFVIEPSGEDVKITKPASERVW
jgi:hypothetical protein